MENECKKIAHSVACSVGDGRRLVAVPLVNTHTTLNRNQVWVFDAASENSSGFVASAIVNGGVDLSVAVVTRQGTTAAVAGTGFLPGGPGDPSFERAGTTLYTLNKAM